MSERPKRKASSAYLEKLKDPRWQQKRLRIMERDEFACQACFDRQTTLHVHHRYYDQGCDPWDYPDEALVTLCETCHEEERDARSHTEERILRALRMRFLARDLDYLAYGFEGLQVVHMPEIVAQAVSGLIQNAGRMNELVASYLKPRAVAAANEMDAEEDA